MRENLYNNISHHLKPRTAFFLSVGLSSVGSIKPFNPERTDLFITLHFRELKHDIVTALILFFYQSQLVVFYSYVSARKILAFE